MNNIGYIHFHFDIQNQITPIPDHNPVHQDKHQSKFIICIFQIVQTQAPHDLTCSGN